MKQHYDVLVIGGGIIGHSIAYSLSKRGKSVLILEKEKINQRATSAAAGMLAVQAEFTEAGPLFELARDSRNMFPSLAQELKERTNIDIELIKKGMLSVALTEEKVHQLQASTRFQKATGEETSWLSDNEVRRLEPHLSKKVLGAMYAPNDGQVSAPKLAASFAKGAESLGTRILEYTEVVDFIIEEGRVQGVITNTENFYTETVVVTCGAWTQHIIQKSNLIPPIYPVKGECFSVRTTEELLAKTIFSEDCYIVPKREGRLIVGATMIPHNYDETVTVAGISQLLKSAINLLPALEGAEWEKSWAGIRPQTFDGQPYLGEHPFIKGLYVASGHFRNGILLSPITGEIMADMIEGKLESHNLAAFSLDHKKRRKTRIEATN
ncbi:glycine oxidase ThiO [Bacillus sp. DJP31]|uniref:glycine oxidase ThiO n=1 Tax=Bacillus sp. DJP31 TaxID=3409789 RepID=UPI003BB5820A